MTLKIPFHLLYGRDHVSMGKSISPETVFVCIEAKYPFIFDRIELPSFMELKNFNFEIP